MELNHKTHHSYTTATIQQPPQPLQIRPQRSSCYCRFIKKKKGGGIETQAPNHRYWSGLRLQSRQGLTFFLTRCEISETALGGDVMSEDFTGIWINRNHIKLWVMGVMLWAKLSGSGVSPDWVQKTLMKMTPLHFHTGMLMRWRHRHPNNVKKTNLLKQIQN